LIVPVKQAVTIVATQLWDMNADFAFLNVIRITGRIEPPWFLEDYRCCHTDPQSTENCYCAP
jgi:hypothetical protein